MSESNSLKIRVAVFDDNDDRRMSLKYLIGMLPDMEFVGDFSDATRSVEKVNKSKPDVILMDIEMPGVTGIEAVSEIKKAFPEVSILMQTIFDDESMIFDALKAGASGYLLKKGTPEKVIEGVREAYQGGAPMSPAIATKVLAFFRNMPNSENDDEKEEDKPDYGLTVRQKEILTELVNGSSYKMIAATMNISYNTVNTHIRHVYEKLHVHSLGEAVAKALKERII
ncbi:response regulator transcription factor [Cryomorphaceae bacterium 1068]|nr:response regulator transcription factor [Cryomorphaceae bacterium 1068]